MENKSIIEKVDFIMRAVIDKDSSPECLKALLEYSQDHSDDLILGRVFGWSVSDYAIAALKWLNTDESIKKFFSVFDSLSKQRQCEVSNLVASEIYKQY